MDPAWIRTRQIKTVMQLFYNPSIENSTTELTFDKEESKHIVRVLRKKGGDILHITNGSGWLFEAQLILADQKSCLVRIIKAEERPPLPHQLHLAVAPTKMNDRYEWFLEKATEIGASEITPIICEHSERKVVKLARLEKVVQSAMKQSLQCYLPKLNEAISLGSFMKQPFDGQKFIAHCGETERFSLKSKIDHNPQITILIGPEGDFSTSEIQQAKEKGFLPVMLGDTRLRTETAAIVACHTVALANQL